MKMINPIDLKRAKKSKKEADQWLKRKEYEMAIKEYEIAVDLNPNYKQALCGLGIAYHKFDVEKAIYYVEKALEIDPNYKDAQYNLNILLKKRDKPDKAAKPVETVKAVETVKPAKAFEPVETVDEAYKEGNTCYKCGELTLKKCTQCKQDVCEAHIGKEMFFGRLRFCSDCVATLTTSGERKDYSKYQVLICIGMMFFEIIGTIMFGGGIDFMFITIIIIFSVIAVGIYIGFIYYKKRNMNRQA